MANNLTSVWVFIGEGARFPSAIFSNRDDASEWIKNHFLSGILTEYPVNIGVYEWAINNGFFSITKDHESSKEFIQKFTSASQKHFHYENGQLD